ncbi:MAG: ABC transporter transmembrane domain-containing protein, partial [Treponemataceae bacterium]
MKETMSKSEGNVSFAGQIIYILKPMWKRIALVLGLSFVASGLSLLSVGVMAPYIGLIEKPDTAFRDNSLFVSFIRAFSLDSTKEILIAVSVSLMIIFIVKNAVFFVVKYVISYTNLQIVRKLKYRLFRAYMFAPYSFHQGRNTMQLINTATTDIGGFSQNIVSNILELIVDSLVFSLTLAMLIWMTPQLMVVALILVAAMFFFHRFSRLKTFKYGRIGTETNALSLKIMNQGLQGIVPVKVYGVEDFFISRNDEAIKENVRSSAKYFTFVLFPRIGFETL